MKKVAVLTFHRANNYGAVLQAHALTNVINKLGAEAEILDYRPDKAERFYHSYIPRAKNLKGFCALMHHRYLRDGKTYRAFAAFRREVMKISSQVYTSPSELQCSNELYDLFVAGSDQIWNPDIVAVEGEAGDCSYLLDFVKSASKKNSYAASIGVSVLGDEVSKIYREKLSGFANITVREHVAAEVLEALLNRPVGVVCDPVLLLSDEEWKSFERPYPLRSSDYILVYSVGGKMELMPYARDLAKAEGCAVYSIQPPIVGTVSDDSSQALSGVGPAEFVWLIRHARAVVTTSFHGSAFSLLFRKPLHVLQENKLKASHRNSRFDSLFKYFGICPGNLEEIITPDGLVKIVSPDTHDMKQLETSKQHSMQILFNILN